MKLKNYVLLLSLMLSSQSWALMNIHFDLKDTLKEDCDSQCDTKDLKSETEASKLAAIVNDPDFWKAYLKVEDRGHRLDKKILVIGVDKEDLAPKELEALGMSSDKALLMSRDNIQTGGCAAGHDQGDMANRWCHSAISNSFSSWLESKGVSSTVASLAGGIFWAPKEFLYDLNPSAHDMVFTFKDKLGTKSTTLEVAVFGDTFFKKYMGKDFAPMKESTPFVTIKRRF